MFDQSAADGATVGSASTVVGTGGSTAVIVMVATRDWAVPSVTEYVTVNIPAAGAVIVRLRPA